MAEGWVTRLLKLEATAVQARLEGASCSDAEALSRGSAMQSSLQSCAQRAHATRQGYAGRLPRCRQLRVPAAKHSGDHEGSTELRLVKRAAFGASLTTAADAATTSFDSAAKIARRRPGTAVRGLGGHNNRRLEGRSVARRGLARLTQ